MIIIATITDLTNTIVYNALRIDNHRLYVIYQDPHCTQQHTHQTIRIGDCCIHTHASQTRLAGERGSARFGFGQSCGESARGLPVQELRSKTEHRTRECESAPSVQAYMCAIHSTRDCLKLYICRL